MKLSRFLVCAASLFAFALPSFLSAADTAKTAAGYWAGTVTTPRGEQPLAVEFIQDNAGAWQATVDYPRQGVRGFKPDAVKVTDTTVEFVCPGLPGDPRLAGKLGAGGATIDGGIEQGGGTIPFHLERKTKPEPTPDVNAVPARGVAGQGLAGQWRGSIKPVPAIELRLQVELQADTTGKISGNLLSLDQGGPALAIETLTEKDGSVKFDVPRVRGGFEGKLNADGSEIMGEWTQGGNSTPLLLRRLPAKG